MNLDHKIKDRTSSYPITWVGKNSDYLFSPLPSGSIGVIMDIPNDNDRANWHNTSWGRNESIFSNLSLVSGRTGIFGYTSSPVKNNSLFEEDTSSVEVIRQAIREALTSYFGFDDQKVTLEYIYVNQWMIFELVDCSHFIRKRLTNLERLSIQYIPDLETLYINVVVNEYEYDKLIEFRDSFFDFIVGNTNLFKFLNISFSPNEF